MKSCTLASLRPAVRSRAALCPEHFPWQGTPREQFEFLLEYALFAPSTHNTQPWLFRIAGPRVHVYGDYQRAMRVVDPDNRELIMSCGSALLNLRVAIRNFGLTAMTELCPDPDDPALLATVELTGKAPCGQTDHKLFKAIPERRTARVPFHDRPIPRALLFRWQRAAAYEDAEVYFVESPDQRRAIADLIAEGDRRLGCDPEYRHELSRWLRPNRSTGRDGLPGYSVGLGDLPSQVASQRTTPHGVVLASRDVQLALQAPAFAILGVEEDTPRGWMIAGQALGRFLLAAQAEGVSASFFLQPIEIPDLRQKLTALLPTEIGYPQIAFRLGYGPRVPATPRRPLSDVLMIAD